MKYHDQKNTKNRKISGSQMAGINLIKIRQVHTSVTIPLQNLPTQGKVTIITIVVKIMTIAPIIIKNHDKNNDSKSNNSNTSNNDNNKSFNNDNSDSNYG